MSLPCYRCNQTTLPGWDDALVSSAIAALQLYAPKTGQYWGCFSGGKDSVCIKELARMAGLPVDWHYSVTTIDPPELVYFIKREHPDVSFDRPKRNFFTAMIATGVPSRACRWCCREFKESRSPKGARLILGVRAAESPRRAKNWQIFTPNRRAGGGVIINPILHWHDDDVWRFIKKQNLPYCCLYDEGFNRLGCIGCPLTTSRDRDRGFARWPGYAKLWRRAFERLWEQRAATLKRDGGEWYGSANFCTWQQWFEWWKSDDRLPAPKCQGTLELWS